MKQQLMNKNQIKVLFVCMGNICRSPTAQGIFRKLVAEAGLSEQIEIDSAGTHAYYHLDEPPDPRACQMARTKGINLNDLRARQIESRDFTYYNYILAMDEENYFNLIKMCPPEAKNKIILMMSFAPNLNIREVPDPYYGGQNGFDKVFNLLEISSKELLAKILAQI